MIKQKNPDFQSYLSILEINWSKAQFEIYVTIKSFSVLKLAESYKSSIYEINLISRNMDDI